MLRRPAVIVALLLGAWLFADAMHQGSQVFLGEQGVDAWGTQWFYWFAGRALARGEPIGHTDLFFFPWGKDVYLHTGANVLDALLAWPWRWVLGPVAGYNLYCLALLASNAWAAARVARALGAPGHGGQIAGVLFAANPYLLAELAGGRPTQVMCVFVLLFWADFFALRERPGWRGAARAGVLLALAGLTYWYYALFSGMAAALLTLLARGPALRWRVLAGVIALVCVLPVALPMLRAEDVPGLLDVSTWTLRRWSPTTVEGYPIGIYSLRALARTAGFYALTKDDKLTFIQESTAYLRVQVALVVVAFGLRESRRGALLALLVIGLAIATGPQLATGWTNPAYLFLVQIGSVFRRLWWPQRALLLVHLAALGAAAAVLERAWRRPVRGVLVTVLVGGAWAWELGGAGLAPFPSWPAGIPAGYRCLAAAPDGAVLELPYGLTQEHLYDQTRHGKPIFGGMVEDNPVFTPPEQRTMREKNTFVAMLIDQAEDPTGAVDARAEDRAAFGALGYRYVLLDKRAYLLPGHEEAKISTMHEGDFPAVRRALLKALGAPVYEDDRTLLWMPWGGDAPCPNLERSPVPH